MTLTWQAVDPRSDPREAEHLGDPGDLVATFMAELLRRPAAQAGAACRGAGAARWYPGRVSPVELPHQEDLSR